MILFRALNDYEIKSDPEKNGLASKQVLRNLTAKYYENIKDVEYLGLKTNEDKIKFIDSHICDYIDSHLHKLEKYYIKENKECHEIVNRILARINDVGDSILFRQYLSTLQGHLLHGSRHDTNWISTSKSLESIKKYYDRQNIHKVALIGSHTNGIVDRDGTLVMDVSSAEKIKDNPFLFNKEDDIMALVLACISCQNPLVAMYYEKKYLVKTNPKSRGFSYSKASNEVCIYEYLPSSHIIAVLEALQMDLISYGLFNTKYFNDKKILTEHQTDLERLKKDLLKKVKSQNDPYLLHVFNELYLENKNINSLVTFTDSLEKVNDKCFKILQMASTINNPQIKK